MHEKPFCAVVLGALVALLAGCGPPDIQYVNWAPDGQRAFVSSGRMSPQKTLGTYVVDQMMIDASGKRLSLQPGHEGVLAWMPDSRRVIIARWSPARDWHDYAQVLGPTRSLYVKAAATDLGDLVAANKGDWNAFDRSLALRSWNNRLKSIPVDASQALYFLEQTRPQLIAPLVVAANGLRSYNPEEEVFNPDDIEVPAIVELRLRGSAAADAGDHLLIRSSEMIWWAVPSPKGTAVAYAISSIDNSDDSSRLYLVSLQGRARPIYLGRLVDSEWGSSGVAWSADGQNLVFTQASDDLSLITQVRVCSARGTVLPNPGPSEVLVRAAAREPGHSDRVIGRVAALPDGRILFTGATSPLPAVASARSTGSTFYALRLQPKHALERLVPDSLQAQLPYDVDDFVVSPDGKKIAIYGSHGSVSVFFIDPVKYMSLQGDIDSSDYEPNEPVTLPSWKSADELTYLIPAGDPAGSLRRAEIVIASLKDGTKRVISRSWPDRSLLPRLKKK